MNNSLYSFQQFFFFYLIILSYSLFFYRHFIYPSDTKYVHQYALYIQFEFMFGLRKCPVCPVAFSIFNKFTPLNKYKKKKIKITTTTT